MFKSRLNTLLRFAPTPFRNLNPFSTRYLKTYGRFIEHFSVEDANAIKDIEKTTNHDVKAVEYFLKNEFDRLGISNYKEFIHFGLTSQDVNNTAVPLSIKDALEIVILPEIEKTVLLTWMKIATQHDHIPMLSRTLTDKLLPLAGWEKKFKYLAKESNSK